MVQLNGFVKIHRKMLRWGWYTDPVVKSLFLHFLLTANFKQAEWMGRTLKPGQLVTSYAHLAAELGFTVRQIRTAFNKLKLTGEITSEATNKYTVVTVANWENYQSVQETETGEQATQRQANDKPTTNQWQTNDNSVRIQEEKKKRNQESFAPEAPEGPLDQEELDQLAWIAELRR